MRTKKIVALTLCAGILMANTPHIKVKANAENKITSVLNENNKVVFSFSDNSKMQINFLRDDMFRVQKVDANGQFVEKIAPPSSHNNAFITVKNDAEFGGSQYTYNETETAVTLTNSHIKMIVDKVKGTIKLTKTDGTIIFEEESTIQLSETTSFQTLKTNASEYFFGGGTQNGRFSHKGNRIAIVNTNNWTDGGVASPNPFYWSTKGYGMVRNSYAPGYYDFAKENASNVINHHNDKRFDAYYFVGETPKNLINDYVDLTGKPIQIPDYTYYLSHLNCYNRDYWAETGNTNDRLIDGKYYKEYSPSLLGSGNAPANAVKESLMPQGGNDTFTAKKQIDIHVEKDMPLGWFLPNDGYGCGFGQDTTSLDNNIQNLKAFVDYANTKGVVTGLWTQSDLTPKGSNPILQRDFDKEVNIAGVRSLKTDVAWVGHGYTFGLNGLELASRVLDKANEKHNVVTLDGWAGTQRYGGIWSGDQSGGNWEYIRFHIPTYIGTGLSGQPHIGSDVDGIFGGRNPIVNVRDFQFKSFSGYMLDMDGWGTSQKNPWEFGGKYTDINRAYLKLKAQLLPYIATEAQHAHETGTPILRAMMLEYPNEYTYGKATQYQYLWGSNFLVAPIYQNTAMQDNGNDIRNEIYLPNNNDGTPIIWIDYLTGQQYRGGNVINNFDAPLYKMPIFVKNGSIIPMYSENNNPSPKTTTNPKGLDRSLRIVEFYPDKASEYTQYEDDGRTKNGASISTRFTSNVNGETAVLTAHRATSKQDVSRLAINKASEFVVNVSKAPTNVTLKLNDVVQTLQKVDTKEAYDNATGNVYYYDESPETFVTKYAQTADIKMLNIQTTPKLFVKSTNKINVLENKLEVTVEGFENAQVLSKDELNANLSIPTNVANNTTVTTSKQIGVSWNAVDNATSYDVEADGIIFKNITEPNFVHGGLLFSTPHTYRARAVNNDGYSNWSDAVQISTLDDPYRNVPEGYTITANVDAQAGSGIEKLYDRDLGTQWHTNWNKPGQFNELIVNLNGSYDMDKFEYVPRPDAGNGTMMRGKVLVSRDGVHYKEVGTFDWERSATTKTFKFPENIGRFSYIKLSEIAALGGFGAGQEFVPYAKDPKRPFMTFDYNADKTINDGETTFLSNYAGLSTHQNDNDWGYVEIADVNYNGWIDATDISAITRMLDGGVTYTPGQHAKGKIKVIADKTTASANDKVTFRVYAIGFENVNAISAVLPIDDQKYENVVITPSFKTIEMSNYSLVRKHSNNQVTANVLLANTGGKVLFNGDGLIATITAQAKKDITVNETLSHAMVTNKSLVDDNAFFVDDTLTEPTVSEGKLPANTITSLLARNAHLGDWSDPTPLFQDGYRQLYDGNVDTASEFKWYLNANSFGPEVVVPTDLKFNLNQPREITRFRVVNRTNLNGNGTVTSIKASYVDVDGVEHEIATYPDKRAAYDFVLPENTTVQAIIVTPLTSQGNAAGIAQGNPTNRMLTLQEVELYGRPTTADAIAFVEPKLRLFKDELATYSATVTPSNAVAKLYTITSENPDIIQIERFVNNGKYDFLAIAKASGTAKLIATLNSDPTVKAEINVEVDGSLNLEEHDLYKEHVLEHLQDETIYDENYIKELRELLRSLDETQYATQDDVDKAAYQLAMKMGQAVYRGNKESKESTSPISGALTATQSSYAEYENDLGNNVLDNNPDTIWHSNYGGAHPLPQYVEVDLQKVYNLSQIGHLPRQSNGNGHITQYRVAVSVDGVNYVPVSAGYIENNGATITNANEEYRIKFNPVQARYVRFIAEKTLGSGGRENNRYASIAELKFYEYEPAQTLRAVDQEGNTHPHITVTADEYTIPVSQQLEFVGEEKGNSTIEGNDAVVYDLFFRNTQTKEKADVITTDEVVTVKLPVDPQKTLKGVYYVENGQLTEEKELVNYKAGDSYVIFKTSHFSTYAVVYEKELDVVKFEETKTQFTQINESLYTEDSVNTVKAKIAEIETALAEKQITQETLNTQVEVLIELIKAMKLKQPVADNIKRVDETSSNVNTQDTVQTNDTAHPLWYATALIVAGLVLLRLRKNDK